MDGIKIEVTGNIARVIERPAKITSGTVGLPVEFTFDSQWDNLHKLLLFRAGNVIKSVDLQGSSTTVPWEALMIPGLMLSIGVYGANAEGTVVIPTIWANVCGISIGVDPEGDPSADPTLPIWQQMFNYIASLTTRPASRVVDIVLRASAWVGSDKIHSQVVEIEGITAQSQVDLKPSVEQMAIFHEKDIAFSTENEDGVVTVYVVGDKPVLDYTIQASVTEVTV